MFMLVMQIRQMGMGMRQRRMLVTVRVRLWTFVAAVRVLMMLIVDVPMSVRHIFVRMPVGVPLGKHEPRGGNHQRKRDAERNRK